MTVNIGANRGDKITFDVRCDHDIQGQCLVNVPKLSDGSGFMPVKNEFRHQQYELTVPAQGNQIVTAEYWWVGASVHYYIRIVAVENI